MEERLEKEAEEFRKKLKEQILCDDDFERLEQFDVNVEEAYIEGAKAHLPQWHDLRIDPNDLPKETKEYLVKEDVWGNLVDKLVIYNAMKNFWCSDCQQDIIAWCETPKFEEDY